MQRPSIDYRPNTSDELTFREVFDEDVYRLDDFDVRLAAISGKPCLDLGANVGAFTIRALLMGADHVHAVEPDPANVKQLRRNLQQLGLINSVSIHRGAAVGDWNASLTLRLIHGDSDYPSISYQAHADTADGIEVAAIPFSYLLRQESGWGVVKCDVEGAEYDIFDRLDLDLFNTVEAVTMEFHGRGMGAHLDWIPHGSLGTLVENLSEWGHVETLGAASRGGQLYGYRY